MYFKATNDTVKDPFFLDIDECTDETDKCVHLCTNTPGSYLCTCDSGYQLEADGFSCQGKNSK